jgi:hypothetical protein
MFPLLLGLSLFVVAVIITTALKNFYKIIYPTHPLVFSSLFIGLMVTVQFIHPVFNLTILVYSIFIGLIYLALMSLLRISGLLDIMFGTDSLPGVHKEITQPKIAGDLVKVVEVLLQDMSAWLIVLGLFELFSNLYVVIATFTVLVSCLHLPGLSMFGKVYGSYFLAASTLLAFSVPLLFSLGTIGFLIIFSLHLFSYIGMYILMGFFGSRKIIK